MNVIGIDLGTTTLSALAVDEDSGAVLERVTVAHGAALPRRHACDALQDPDAVASLACDVAEALARRHGAAAIGLDGQMHGMLYVDRAGRAVSPLYTWQDARGDLPLGDATYAAELSRRAGRRLSTGYGLVTHFWHLQNNAVPEEAAKLCGLCDYVGMKLTGRTAPLTHASTAASMGPLMSDRPAWDLGALSRAGIGEALLPEVTDAFTLLGETPAAVPVACGIGDNQASFIGAMADMEGGALVNMGTGGQVSALHRGNTIPEGLEARPLGEGRSILVGASLCGGRAYALLEGFLRACARLGGGGDAPLYEAMNRLALEALDDPDPLVVDTRFTGTRDDPGLRGGIANIGERNLDPAHLAAGTLLGMARELHDLYLRIDAPARALVGSGNALRKNPALRRAFERVFKAPLCLPAHDEEAAYGAALCALVATGNRATLSDAQRVIRYL